MRFNADGSPERFEEAVRRLEPAVAPKPQPITVYLDEGSTGQCRYMAIGGLWISPECERSMREKIAEIRRRTGMRESLGEFKWTKLSSKRPHPAYMPLVDAFFDSRGCRFNALVIDRQNPGRNRGEDPELDYYVAMHWLVRRRIRVNEDYQVVLDHRSNKQSDRLTELRDVLNNAARLDTGVYRTFVQEVRAKDSRKECMIQLADVLLGAVCFHFNGRHCTEGASVSKCALAKHIAERAGFRAGVIGSTARGVVKFNVWLWQPR